MTDLPIGAQRAFQSRKSTADALPVAASGHEAANSPAAVSDRVTIDRKEAPGYSYVLQKDGQGVQYQTWAAKSGITYTVAKKGEETRFKIEIPQGVSSAPIEITGAAAPGTPTQLEAHLDGPTLQSLAVQETADHKYVIGLGPNGLIAMFDPRTMDFGVETPTVTQSGPNGQPLLAQAQREVVHADNSRTIEADRLITDVQPMPGTPGFRDTRFIEIDETSHGGVSASAVVERQTPLGTDRQENPLAIHEQFGGVYEVSGGTLADHVKANWKAFFSDPLTLHPSPYASWKRMRGIPPMVIRPLLTSVAAVTGPAAAVAASVPLSPPVPS